MCQVLASFTREGEKEGGGEGEGEGEGEEEEEGEEEVRLYYVEKDGVKINEREGGEGGGGGKFYGDSDTVLDFTSEDLSVPPSPPSSPPLRSPYVPSSLAPTLPSPSLSSSPSPSSPLSSPSPPSYGSSFLYGGLLPNTENILEFDRVGFSPIFEDVR